MKKLFLTLGLATLFMVACNNTPKQQEEQQPEQAPETTEQVVEEKQECPMAALRAEFANWENMAEADKDALIQKACDVFAQMEAKRAEMEAEGKACCKEGKEECEKKMAEMTDEQKAECEAKKAEMEAKCAEMKAAWDNFANLNLDEQKDLILKRLEGCGEPKPCCKGEGKPCGEKPTE